MSVRIDPKRGNCLADCRYRDAVGAARRKTKRGFPSREAAEEWEREFAAANPLDMTISEFWAVYESAGR